MPNRPDEVANLTRGVRMDLPIYLYQDPAVACLRKAGTLTPPLVNVSRLGGMMKHWGLRIQFYRIIGAGVRRRDQTDVIGDV